MDRLRPYLLLWFIAYTVTYLCINSLSHLNTSMSDCHCAVVFIDTDLHAITEYGGVVEAKTHRDQCQSSLLPTVVLQQGRAAMN